MHDVVAANEHAPVQEHVAAASAASSYNTASAYNTATAYNTASSNNYITDQHTTQHEANMLLLRSMCQLPVQRGIAGWRSSLLAVRVLSYELHLVFQILQSLFMFLALWLFLWM